MATSASIILLFAASVFVMAVVRLVYFIVNLFTAAPIVPISPLSVFNAVSGVKAAISDANVGMVSGKEPSSVAEDTSALNPTANVSSEDSPT